MSGQFVVLLPRRVRALCRQIDRVRVKGSAQPIDLFTFDLFRKFERKRKKSASFVLTESPRNLVEMVSPPAHTRAVISFTGDDWFFEDPDIREIIRGIPGKFLETFNDAFAYYLKGDWQAAHTGLTNSLKLHPVDKPTHILLEMMEKHEFKPPEGWDGCRQLTEKK
eukprot:231283_1